MTQGDRRRLLLMDDDDVFRKTTATRLRHLGYEVREASGGEEALGAVSADLDLVLLDLGLPDRDGVEVLGVLSSAWPELPLLVVSGAEEVGTAVEALRGGAWDYLLKPLGDRESLSHALERAFERRDLLRENRAHREHLEEQVADRTRRLQEELAERSRVEEELRRSQEDLRSLASELSLAEERERRRVAVDLHDGVGQTLALLKMKFSHLRRTAGEALPSKPFDEIGALVEEAIARVRALTLEVSSPVLYEVGFEAAVSALAGKMLDEHGIAWTLHDDWQPKPLAEDVKVLLFQVVRELLHNVVKHAEARRVTLSLRREGRELVCTVADDGKGGVREEERPQGGGFGLFSIRERLFHLGARFELHSSPGEGTTGILRAPLLIPREASRKEEARPPIRVLLADDHDLFRRGVRALLEPYADLDLVGEAEDGEAALALARECHPDVVLLDVSMGRHGGIEAARRFSEEFPKTAILGLSMHANPFVVREMLDAGGAGYLLKDCDPEELARAIRAVAAGEAAFSAPVAAAVAEDLVRQRRRGQEALSVREEEVLRRLAEGESIKEIAAALGISAKTVETYRERIGVKLGLHTVVDMTKYALRKGIVAL